ncbi:MAG: type II secretion system F family protein [Gemmatimonadota bacterium]
MILFVTVSVFVAAGLFALAIFIGLERRKESLVHRFREVAAAGTSSRTAGAPPSAGIGERLRRRLLPRRKATEGLVERIAADEATGSRILLSQAGYRSPGAYRIYLAIRAGLPALAFAGTVVLGRHAGISNRGILLLAFLALAVGLLLPRAHLASRIRKRQEEIRDGLPDALDLLVVCVEAGLGLNAAFIKISEEFRISSPRLSAEFDIVNREMVAGKPRIDALRALATRTGVEDVKSLVAMLIQTERLGTSLSQSLRVHSDSLRTKRRQRAEEAAAKTTIKLVFPLVFCLFPGLFVVILGPGAIQIFRMLIRVAP